MNRRFKLIKDYPNCYWNVGDVIENSVGCLYTYKDLCNGKYSEFWKEVNEPLFITEDGIEMFEGDAYWWIMPNGKLHHNTCAQLDCNDSDTKRFSTREAAEKWIENAEKIKKFNERKFSTKDICDALECSEAIYVWDENLREIVKAREILFKQKLGI